MNRYPKETISKAISSSPALAGIPEYAIDEIADDVINYERNCVSGISTALGMPGGISLAATIPADIVQYYGYTLRTIQKLLYLYGSPEIDADEDGLALDSTTVNRIILCLGVMYGVAGASNAIKAIAKALSVGVEKKLLSMALTKGTLYPILKSVLKWFGVKLTKDVLAKSVKNAIPVFGGVVGGGITFIPFKPCCLKLKDASKDTVLSDPSHVSSAEEDEIFTVSSMAMSAEPRMKSSKKRTIRQRSVMTDKAPPDRPSGQSGGLFFHVFALPPLRSRGRAGGSAPPGAPPCGRCPGARC